MFILIAEVQSPDSNFSDSTFTFDQSRLSSPNIYSAEEEASPGPGDQMRGDKPFRQVQLKLFPKISESK